MSEILRCLSCEDICWLKNQSSEIKSEFLVGNLTQKEAKSKLSKTKQKAHQNECPTPTITAVNMDILTQIDPGSARRNIVLIPKNPISYYSHRVKESRIPTE